jgi:hypothetical protein
MDNIRISKHAVDQFNARTKAMGGGVPKDPMTVILKLLSRAVIENMAAGHKINRLIKHGYRDAKYYVSEGWRFVAIDKTVITIERQNPAQN